MNDILATLSVAASTALMTAWVARGVARRQPLPVENYRGMQVTTGGGIAVILGFLAAQAALMLTWTLFSDYDQAVIMTGAAQAARVGVLFGLIGFVDDVLGDRNERGWAAHIGALRRLQPTAGSIKIVASILVAYSLTSPAMSLGNRLLFVLTLALCANAANAFDLRPLRLLKVAGVVAVALSFGSGLGFGAMCLILAAILGIAPLERAERIMLGDAGAYAIGGAIGYTALSRWGTGDDLSILPVFAAVVVINLLAVKPGISRIIARIAPLRRLDAAGRRTSD